MMLVSSAVFSAVLAGQPKASLEDEDEDEDEQRSRVFKKKMYSARSHPLLQDVLYVSCLDANLVSAGGFTKLFNQQNKMKMSSDQFDDGDEDGVEDNQQNKMKMSSDQFDDVEYQKMEAYRGRWKVKVGKDWTEEEFEDEDEDEDNQQNKIKKALKDVYRDFDSARMFHKAIQPSIFNRVREKKKKFMDACFASEPSITRNIKDIIDFKLSVDQPKIISVLSKIDGPWVKHVSDVHSIIKHLSDDSAHEGTLQLHEVKDAGASFSLTEDLCIPLPPRHRPRGLAQHNLHRPRGLAQHNLHRHRPRGLAQLLRVLSHVWIYDTGTSFSLTGDLSLLPGVCSTGDCSPFLGLRHADPVSAANGQSVVSNKCGRASGTLNLSRTAPQTTGLISSSEPIAADNSSLLTPDTTPEQTWRVASAAPQHMTGYLNHLIDYTPASGDQVIDTPNMGPLAVHGRGSVNTTNITLQDVLYVPCLDANLVSTGQLAQLGYMITLGPYGCRIYKDDEDMPLVGEAHYVDGYLLELDFLRVRPSTN